MMKFVLGIVTLFALTGCGSILINPRSCNSPGSYGVELEEYNHSISKEYYAFFMDREVKLKEIVDCSRVNKMKVSITKKMFFKYIVDIKFKEDI